KLPVNGAQEDNGGSRRWPFSPRGPAGTITWPSVQGTITWPTGQVMVHYTVTGVAAGSGMVGPVGLEPTTKGFTRSAVSGGSGLSLHPRAIRPVGCGTLEPVIKSAFESGRGRSFRALR